MITIKNLQKRVPVKAKRIKRAILKVLAKESRKSAGEITVCFVTNSKIKGLNKKYLGKNNPTDVLAFDSSTADRINADIVISADTAARNARIFKTSVSSELQLYSLHGLLHILGYDDRRAKDARLMRRKEKTYADT